MSRKQSGPRRGGNPARAEQLGILPDGRPAIEGMMIQFHEHRVDCVPRSGKGKLNWLFSDMARIGILRGQRPGDMVVIEVPLECLGPGGIGCEGCEAHILRITRFVGKYDGQCMALHVAEKVAGRHMLHACDEYVRPAIDAGYVRLDDYQSLWLTDTGRNALASV